jgi:hypothetical protein
MGVMVDTAKSAEHDCLVASTSKRNSRLVQVYEWFLELPVPIVLAVMWLAGAVLISLYGLTLYFFWLLLRTLVAG